MWGSVFHPISQQNCATVKAPKVFFHKNEKKTDSNRVTKIHLVIKLKLTSLSRYQTQQLSKK